MLSEGIRLSARHRRLLYGVSGVLWASGAVWLVFHHFVRVPGEFGDSPHPLEPLSLRIHGLSAMLTLLALGSLVRGHIRAGWKIRRNRWSGAILVAAASVLIATGWALYYVSSETARSWISLVHWGLGLLSVIAVSAHVYSGGRERCLAPQSRPAPSSPEPHSRIRVPAARQITSS